MTEGEQAWDRHVHTHFLSCPHACGSLCLAQEVRSGPTCSPSRAPSSLGPGLAPAWRG